MDERTLRRLQFLTVQVVGAVAVLHLVVGGEELISLAANGLLGTYLSTYAVERPRALLFVPSGLAVLGGIVAAGRGYIGRRTAYRLGLLAMGVYLVGWVGWHTVLNHGFALANDAPATTPHSHEGILATLYSHYVEPLLAAVGAATSDTGSVRTLLGIVSVTLELIAVALLVILLRHDPAAQTESESSWFRLRLNPPE